MINRMTPEQVESIRNNIDSDKANGILARLKVKDSVITEDDIVYLLDFCMDAMHDDIVFPNEILDIDNFINSLSRKNRKIVSNLLSSMEKKYMKQETE